MKKKPATPLHAPWSLEEYEALRAHAAAGFTAAMAMRALNAQFNNGRTRNAILGAAHRAGFKVGHPNKGIERAALKRRGSGFSEPKKRPRILQADPEPVTRTRKPSRLAKLISGNDDMLFIDHDFPKSKGPPYSVRDLTSKICRWIDGDPRAERPFACGEPKVAGKPYCVDHGKRAWGPSHRGRMSA